MKPRSELVQQIALHDPAAPAVSDGNGVVLNYQQLLREVLITAADLEAKAITGLAIAGDNSISQLVLDVACLEAGVWTLQCPPFFTPEQVQHALQASGCRAMLSDRPMGTSSDTLEVAGQTLYLTLMPGQIESPSVIDDTAKVTFTSGSTAQPKGLCLAEKHLMAPVKALAEALTPHELKRHLSVLPQAVLLETIAGIYTALYSGACCIVPSLLRTSGAPDIGTALYQLMEAEQAHSAILVPELLEQLVKRCESARTSPAHVRFLPVGGSRVSEKLLQRAQATGLPVYQGYGLSEAGSVVTLNLPGANKQGTVGKVLAHQQLRFADNDEIVLEQPGFLGYCGEGPIHLNASMVDASMADASAEGFATGDSGYLDDEGYLSVNGRLKNVLINSMGRNISPEWIESTLLDQPAIEQVVVYGDAQTTLSALVVTNGCEQEIGTAVSQANATLPEYASVEQWQLVPPFSRENGLLTSNGKLRRAAILDQYADSSETVRTG